eukprot:9973459-Alexandrium_andersonii.AAC.1
MRLRASGTPSIFSGLQMSVRSVICFRMHAQLRACCGEGALAPKAATGALRRCRPPRAMRSRERE